jgi:TIR domain
VGDRLLSHAWIFVSHSNKDIVKVRSIRNRLERFGAQPLLFHLRATFEKPELRELLFREIEARNFFLYCRSQNAERSRWVQNEVIHARNFRRGKVYEEVDLSLPWSQQKFVLDGLAHKTLVYLSFAHFDREKVAVFAKLLKSNEFTVIGDGDLVPGQPWLQRIRRALQEARDRGYFVLFLSMRSLERLWLKTEMDRSKLERRAPWRTIVVELEPLNPGSLPPLFAEFKLVPYEPIVEKQGLRLLALLGLVEPAVRNVHKVVSDTPSTAD